MTRPQDYHACATAGCLLLSFLGLSASAGSIRFTDVTDTTGIDFIHTDGSSGRRYIVETVSAGLALFDYDQDGDMDIYFLNGAPLPGLQIGAPPRNRLYRNEGSWRFTDVTQRAGIGDTGHGLGVAAGDYDHDGDPDLYVNNFGPNVLYRNNGNGTFTDVTAEAGVANQNCVGAGASFLDSDGDGDLDLYVANYVDFTFENHQVVRFSGHPAYVGPMNYRGTPDTLYRNNGDGTFADVSAEAGIAAHRGTGMGMVCADYDNDGDTDVFVGNDVAGNFIFQNNGAGYFTEVGTMTGLAYDLAGRPQGTMGVACGDFNNDGLLDFHVTSYQGDLATLYRNLGDGFFEDITHASGAGIGSFAQVTWGNGLVDLDNDGDKDLFMACGHLQDNVHLFDKTTAYAVRNILMENIGNARFVDGSAAAGQGLQVVQSSRGTAFADLDADGDLDVVVLNSRKKPSLLRNDSSNQNHWVEIRLQGTRTNRSGIGAHVKVVAGDLVQMDEVHSGQGYQSHFGLRLHFGLADRERIDRVEVRWIGGGSDVRENLPVDRLITLIEQ